MLALDHILISYNNNNDGNNNNSNNNSNMLIIHLIIDGYISTLELRCFNFYQLMYRQRGGGTNWLKTSLVHVTDFKIPSMWFVFYLNDFIKLLGEEDCVCFICEPKWF